MFVLFCFLKLRNSVLIRIFFKNLIEDFGKSKYIWASKVMHNGTQILKATKSNSCEVHQTLQYVYSDEYNPTHYSPSPVISTIFHTPFKQKARLHQSPTSGKENIPTSWYGPPGESTLTVIWLALEDCQSIHFQSTFVWLCYHYSTYKHRQCFHQYC